MSLGTILLVVLILMLVGVILGLLSERFAWGGRNCIGHFAAHRTSLTCPP